MEQADGRSWELHQVGGKWILKLSQGQRENWGIPSCVCAGRCLCFECLFSETNIGTCACCVGLFVSCPMFLKHGEV